MPSLLLAAASLRTEARGAPRRRTLKAGIMAFSGRHCTLPCIVRDMSDSGARLRVEGAISPPDNFELIIDLDGFEASSVIVWRNQNEIGIRFAEPPRNVAPKRAQVVQAVVPGQRGSLRRRPYS